jgi:hypothetical protein
MQEIKNHNPETYYGSSVNSSASIHIEGLAPEKGRKRKGEGRGVTGPDQQKVGKTQLPYVLCPPLLSLFLQQ